MRKLGSPNFAFFPFQLLLALPLLLTAALIQKCESLRPAELHLACFSLATVLSVRFVVWAALCLMLLLSTACAQA